MGWEVEFSKVGQRDLAALDLPTRRQAIERLDWLAENFEHLVPLPLHGQWRGFFKLRVGDWRIVYIPDYSRKVIAVRIIDHRSRIYKRR